MRPLNLKFLPTLLEQMGTSSPNKQTSDIQLQSLQEVVYFVPRDAEPEEPDNIISNVVWLFYLPYIKSITARIVEFRNSFEWPQLPPRRLSITSLVLHSSCLRIETLREFISACPRLREFEYQYRCDFNTEVTPDECTLLDCRRLRETIDPLSATLEHLTFGLWFYTDEEDQHMISEATWGVLYTLGDISHFTRLRYLKAPLIMLLGWSCPPDSSLVDNFPPGLAEFCCTNDMCDWYVNGWGPDGVLVQMLPLIHKRSESLKKVVLGAAQEIGNFWLPLVRKAIRSACEQQGIVYDIIECPSLPIPEVT
ncbi:MAG: hypothetical protein Q9218_007179 [Villophora microphyllina]